MAIVKVEREIAKEADDVMVLVVEIVKVLKKKEQVGNLIDDLMAAIDGVGSIGGELEANRKVFLETISARVGTIADVLLPVKE